MKVFVNSIHVVHSNNKKISIERAVAFELEYPYEKQLYPIDHLHLPYVEVACVGRSQRLRRLSLQFIAFEYCRRRYHEVLRRSVLTSHNPAIGSRPSKFERRPAVDSLIDQKPGDQIVLKWYLREAEAGDAETTKGQSSAPAPQREQRLAHWKGESHPLSLSRLDVRRVPLTHRQLPPPVRAAHSRDANAAPDALCAAARAVPPGDQLHAHRRLLNTHLAVSVR